MKFKCGASTVVGPLKNGSGKCGHSRLLCRSLRCSCCRPRRLRAIRARIAELATEHGLTRFATFTLDPKKVSVGVASDRYLRNTWRKMRVKLERQFGQSLPFISILEFQRSGSAHLHVLFNRFIPQAWLSEAWQSIGGGKIVDIRLVEVHRVAGYLTRYLANEKIADTLSLLPRRARIFGTSRGIRFFPKSGTSGWWMVQTGIDLLKRYIRDVARERHELLEESDGEPSLVFFEAGLSTDASRGVDAFKILRSLARAREGSGAS